MNIFSKISILEVDPQGMIIYCSQSSHFESKVGRSFFDLISNKDNSQVKKSLFKIINENSKIETFQARISIEGKETWVELTLTPEVKNNILEKIKIIVYDINKLKEEITAQENLIDSFCDLGEKINTVVFKINLETEKFLFINNKIYDFIGISSDDLRKDSKLFFNKIDPTLKIKSKLDDCSINKNRHFDFFEFNSKTFKIIMSPDNFYSDHSVVSGVLVDVTEQEKIKSELIKAKNSTELLSKQRFNLLAKSSHEIRTPLNGILGATEILLSENMDQSSKRWVRIIEDSSKSLLNIINDILDFSKIDSNKLELNKIDFNFNNLINESLNVFSGICSKKQIKIIVDSNLSNNYIGDANRIKQIILNFLSNAIKFSNKDIILNIKEISNNQIYISVKDFGRGISISDQTKLFEFFSQIGINEGSGLGLSICKSLASLMNGEIGVISDIDQGSEFWVKIPLEKSANQYSEAIKEQTHVEKICNSCQNQILLAEDNETNRAIITQMFKTLGFNIDLAFDGEQALAKANSKKYDLIFMDCEMPKMDGLKATKEIRKNLINKHTPVIALTAHAFDDYKEKCFFSGMNGFLSKPMNTQSLGTVIKKYLKLDLNNPEYDETQEFDILFKKNLYRDVQEIISSLRAGDFETLRVKSHSQKSASNWLHYTKLSGLFKKLEDLAKESNASESQLVLKEIFKIMDKDLYE